MEDARSRVDWGAVFAGAVVATAIGLVLLTFGAGLGLSVTSPYEGEGMGPVAYAIAAGLWILWVQLLSFSIGGYIAARLRAQGNEVTEKAYSGVTVGHVTIIGAFAQMIGFIAPVRDDVLDFIARISTGSRSGRKSRPPS